MRPHELKVLEDVVRDTLATDGLYQFDKRLNRATKYIVGYQLLINDGNLIRWLKGEKPLPKYADDWNRMVMTFNVSVDLALEDPDSRRLVIMNNDEYIGTYQCFTQMQFVKDHSFDLNEYILIVTQRSGDVDKLADDLIFFGNISHKWEYATKSKVRKIIINYGNLHHEE